MPFAMLIGSTDNHLLFLPFGIWGDGPDWKPSPSGVILSGVVFTALALRQSPCLGHSLRPR